MEKRRGGKTVTMKRYERREKRQEKKRQIKIKVVEERKKKGKWGMGGKRIKDKKEG